MATTAVDIVVKVAGSSRLDKLNSTLKGTASQAVATGGKLDRLGNSAKKAGDDAARSTGGFKKLDQAIQTIGRSLAGLAVGDQLRRAFGEAADFSATEQRLANLTKQYQQLDGIQELAAASAQKFGISTAQASSDLADLGSRLGAAGANLKDINDIYEGFNTLLALNSVGTQQAAAAQLQLNQALGAGRLNGDEFNSIAEATPQLLDELAKVLNVTRGELKKLGSEGGITSQALVEALGNIAKDGGAALEEFFKTPAGQLKLFDKAVKDLQLTIGQQLLPVFTPVIEAITTLANLFSQLPGPIKQVAVAVGLLGASFAILGGPITAAGAAIIGLTVLIKKFADENEEFANALKGTWDGIVNALVATGIFFQAFFSGVFEGAEGLISQFQLVGENIQNIWAGTVNFLQDNWNTVISNISQNLLAFQQFFNDVLKAIADAWNSLMGLIPKAWVAAINSLGGVFSGFVNFLGQAFAGISDAWNRLLQSISDNWVNLVLNLVKAFSPVLQLFDAIGIDIGKSIVNGVSAGFAAVSNFQGIDVPSLSLPGLPSQSGLSAPTLAGGGGGGGGRGRGRAGKDPFAGADKEFQKFLKAQQEQLAASEKALGNARFQLDILKAKTEVEKINLQFTKDVGDVLLKNQELYDKALSTQEQDNILKTRSLELDALAAQKQKDLNDLRESGIGSITEEIEGLEAQLNGLDKIYQRRKDIQDLVKKGGGTITEGEAAGLVDRRNELQEQVEAADALKQQYESIASGIASEFTSAFSSIIKGTKDVNEAFADMLQGIADQFLNMAMKILQDALTQQLVKLFTGLFSAGAGAAVPAAGGIGGGAFNIGLGSFDGGGYTGDGPRSGGIDGKGGFPALLHPQETVVDHYQEAQSAMVEPSKAFADSSEAMEMAMATRNSNTASAAEASAMQTAESYFASGKSTVRFDTYRVGEMDVVTREDAIRIGQQSAKQAEANVYKGLRNMPSVRSRSGVK